jgi:hypothetical protein
MDANGNNGNGNGAAKVTFDEVRRMARWLGLFGPSDLADALRCHPDVAERSIRALRAHRLVNDTGEDQTGHVGDERVWEMVPLPDTIYKRDKRKPPEIVAVLQTGGFLLFDERGVTQRIGMSESDRRRILSTPGAAHVHRMREKNRKKMEEAQKARAESQRLKARSRAEGRDLVGEQKREAEQAAKAAHDAKSNAVAREKEKETA